MNNKIIKVVFLYLKSVFIFFGSDQKKTRKIKSIFWFAFYAFWIRDLYDRFISSKLDYVFSVHPFVFYMCRMHSYLIKGSDLGFVSDHLVQHYQHIDRFLGRSLVEKIHADGIILWSRSLSDTCLRVELQYIHIMRFEGQMSIKLILDDTCIYYAHVHLFDNAVWIGGIQGGKGLLASNKKFTKASFGIRPQNFIYLVLTALAKKWRLRAIYGVSSDYHVYQNEKKSNEKVIFDYSEFWRETGGVLQKDNIWFSLPLKYPRKPLQEIASKKRSQYRQRYQLMDDLDKEILNPESYF